MNFRAWYNEWEGNSFPGTPGKDGTGNYGDVGPQTKYNGHGASYGAPSYMNNVEKMYKLKPPVVVTKRANKMAASSINNY